MANVYLHLYDAACAVGISIDEICCNLEQNKSGIKARFFDFEERKEIFVGSFSDEELQKISFNHLCLRYLQKMEVDFSQENTLLIFSTTKGNISELASLHNIVTFFEKELHCKNQPLLISNACVSGISALVQAHDFIKIGYFKKVVVLGIDLISRFVVSGFNALHAISEKPCTPYDSHRSGVSLGEAIAVAVLSDEPSKIEICGGASANDANHISGPSRTGEGLILAVKKAAKNAGIPASATASPIFDVINAHGTATVFNDEMESNAFNTLGFQNIPLNSLKGYFGHTLGAAGLLETLVCAEMMKRNIAYQSLGFEEEGISKPLNILRKNQTININTVLKTASGFGGTNAAIILKKR